MYKMDNSPNRLAGPTALVCVLSLRPGSCSSCPTEPWGSPEHSLETTGLSSASN